MNRLKKPLIAGVAALVGFASCYFFLEHKVDSIPKNSPELCLQGGTKDNFVFFGDSLTHGTLSYRWLDDIEGTPEFSTYQVINAGVNASLAYNLRMRLQDVFACHPKKVFLLVGSNDVNGSLSDEKAEFYMKRMKLPQKPNYDWFRAELVAIITSLTPTSRVAIASIPPIGEDLQSATNAKVAVYNAAIKQIADDYSLDFVPFYAEFKKLLATYPPHKTDVCADRYYFEESATRHYLFRQSWDDISKAIGLHLLTDCIHMNSVSGKLLAKMVIDYQREKP